MGSLLRYMLSPCSPTAPPAMNQATVEGADEALEDRQGWFFRTPLSIIVISVSWCVTREDKISSFHLLVAGEAGFHHPLVG